MGLGEQPALEQLRRGPLKDLLHRHNDTEPTGGRTLSVVHFVLGTQPSDGAPRDPDNLWPEPWFGNWNAKDKDSLESRLNAMVCSNEIGLREAQKDIATDWVAAYKKHICEAGTKLTPIETLACAR